MRDHSREKLRTAMLPSSVRIICQCCRFEKRRRPNEIWPPGFATEPNVIVPEQSASKVYVALELLCDRSCHLGSIAIFLRYAAVPANEPS